MQARGDGGAAVGDNVMTTPLDPVKVIARPVAPVEKRPTRRGSLWSLIWTISLFLVVIVAVVVGFVVSGDQPIWTTSELQELAEEHASDIASTTPTLDPRLQQWVAEVGATYSSDIAAVD